LPGSTLNLRGELGRIRSRDEYSPATIMRQPWKRRTAEDLAATGNVRGLLAVLQPRSKDFIEETSGVYDVGWQRRADAARHLATAEGEKVTPALCDALGDVTPAVRIEALRSLAGRPDADEGVVMGALLAWPEEDARAAAEAPLREHAELSPEGAMRMLEAYLDAPGGVELSHAWVRDIAALADDVHLRPLVAAGVRAELEADDDLPRVRQLLEAGAALATPLVVAELAHERRPAAIRLLGRMRHDAATPSLVELVDDPAPAIRHAAVVALGEIKDPHAIDALLRHTADDDYDVRDAALRALDGFGTAAVVWGLASVARGVLPSITGDDWLRELEGAEVAQLPLASGDHVDADSHDVTETLESEPPLDREAAAQRERRGFWR
jgi:hypothetical protein